MKIPSSLLHRPLIQSIGEPKGWQMSNYTFTLFSEDEISFFDQNETLVHSYKYSFNEAGELVLEDGTIFGKLLDHSNDYVKITRPLDLTKSSVYDSGIEREVNYYISIPETIVNVKEQDFDKLFEGTTWVTNQMGYQITFKYLPQTILDTLWKNQGMPGQNDQESNTVDFSIKSIFGTWFLFLISDQIVVDSFSIYKIELNNIEFVISMIPMTIKNLSRKS